MRFARNLSAVAAALVLVGCASGPHYDIAVYLSEDLVKACGGWPTLEVDVVGVNANEERRLMSYSVSTYFEPGNALRESLDPVRMRFSDENTAPGILSDSDRHWKVWKQKGAQSLLLMVNLPEQLTEQSESASDPRRLLVPLSSGHWYRRDTGDIFFEISPMGIVRLPGEPAVRKTTADEKQKDSASVP